MLHNRGYQNHHVQSDLVATRTKWYGRARLTIFGWGIHSLRRFGPTDYLRACVKAPHLSLFLFTYLLPTISLFLVSSLFSTFQLLNNMSDRPLEFTAAGTVLDSESIFLRGGTGERVS